MVQILMITCNTKSQLSLSLLIAAAITVAFSCAAYAVEGGVPEIKIIPDSGRYVTVDKSSSKFKQQNWMTDGYSGGLKDVSINYSPWKNNQFQGQGSVLFNENDYQAHAKYQSGENSYVKIDMNNFRSYYDTAGGRLPQFSRFQKINLDQDLKMDVEHLRGEIGFKLGEHGPQTQLGYERRTKDGSKSLVSWAGVRENGLTRYVSPTYKNLDETSDTFNIRLSGVVWGAEWSAEQSLELVDTSFMVEERWLSTPNELAAFRKIRDQYQNPKAQIATTALKLEKSYLKKKVVTSAQYRFIAVGNEDKQNMYEYDENRNLTNYREARQVRGAEANNTMGQHILSGGVTWIALKDLQLDAKVRAELSGRESSSRYPFDRSPNDEEAGVAPDGLIDEIWQSSTHQDLIRVGEGGSIRYKGIPRTALYTDFEMEQTQLDLTEGLTGTDHVVNRTTGTRVNDWSIAPGFQISPLDNLSLSGQYKYSDDHVGYDHTKGRQIQDGTNSSIMSAFIDEQAIQTHEVKARVAIRRLWIFDPSFKYCLRIRDYNFLSVFDGSNFQTSNFISNTYSLDIGMNFDSKVRGKGGLFFRTSSIETPVQFDTGPAQTPLLSNDVYGGYYQLNILISKKLTFTNFIQCSIADNFLDYSSASLPYGAEFEEMNASTGFTYVVNSRITIEPRYSFYSYSGGGLDGGDYNAHVIWCGVTTTWG